MKNGSRLISLVQKDKKSPCKQTKDIQLSEKVIKYSIANWNIVL